MGRITHWCLKRSDVVHQSPPGSLTTEIPTVPKTLLQTLVFGYRTKGMLVMGFSFRCLGVVWAHPQKSEAGLARPQVRWPDGQGRVPTSGPVFVDGIETNRSNQTTSWQYCGWTECSWWVVYLSFHRGASILSGFFRGGGGIGASFFDDSKKCEEPIQPHYLTCNRGTQAVASVFPLGFPLKPPNKRVP